MVKCVFFLLPTVTDLETDEGWGGGEHPLKLIWAKVITTKCDSTLYNIGMEQFYNSGL